MATKYTEWPINIQNDYKLYQHLPLQGPPKSTQIGIFGLKIYHLATLQTTLTITKGGNFASFLACVQTVLCVNVIRFRDARFFQTKKT
jgi:hypothetical protein